MGTTTRFYGCSAEPALEVGPRPVRSARGTAAWLTVAAKPELATATMEECGAPNLRSRERVRRHVHAARSATPEPRRGRALPVPPGRLMGPLQQRLPRERRA